MSESKSQLEQKFKKINSKRRDLEPVPKNIQEYLQFMDFKIRKQFKGFNLFSICGADRGNFTVDASFQRAFSVLTVPERIDLYGQYVDHIEKYLESTKPEYADFGKVEQIAEPNQDINMQLKVGKNSKSLQTAQVSIKNLRAKSTGNASFDIDLHNYIFRKSKKKDTSSYALQSIRPAEVETVRFAFLTESDEYNFGPLIKNLVKKACYENIVGQFKKLQQTQALNKQTGGQNRQLKLKMGTKHRQTERSLESARNLNKSIIEEIVKPHDDQELDDQLTQLIEEQNQYLEKNKNSSAMTTPYFKQQRNIYKIILPAFPLSQINSLAHYSPIHQSKQAPLFVYHSSRNHSEFKLQFSANLSVDQMCKAIYNTQLYKHWHPWVNEGQIKVKISSENCCIVYFKMRAISEWYKERDFLLLVHMFNVGNAYYIVMKSIESSNYIPFQAITRANLLYAVWRVEEDQAGKGGKCRVMMEMKVDYCGVLKRMHQNTLSTRFLQGFEQLEKHYRNANNCKKLVDVLSFNWPMTEAQVYYEQELVMNKNKSLKSVDFQDDVSEIEDSPANQTFFSIEDCSDEEEREKEIEEKQKSEHEVNPADNKALNISMAQNLDGCAQHIELNSQGLIILPKKYIKKKHIVAPYDAPRQPIQVPYESILEKDHWIVEKKGGLKMINQTKIDAQNNVIKFIMKTLRKNIMSGKGILNISLPVEIFNIDSNLQRLCQSLSLGPEYLEPATKTREALKRFQSVIVFGFTNSIIYSDCEKPFNPILGETYQGFIRGCPVYAEQISHHPPISSIYFIGRGYKVTANLEAKVNVGLNSGEGINEGLYHVIFDDGHELLFQTPPAELSGLTVGDRRFNIKGRGYYVDPKNELYCEMVMEAEGGLFGKKREFSDQIEGDIVKVKPEFIRKFLDAPLDKRPSPSKSDILQKMSELGGRWTMCLKIDNEVRYDIRKNLPDKMIDDIFPLNSNSNYREDLYYRKMNDLSRSQIQKERLEVIQRGDRKLREAVHGKHH